MTVQAFGEQIADKFQSCCDWLAQKLVGLLMRNSVSMVRTGFISNLTYIIFSELTLSISVSSVSVSVYVLPPQLNAPT